MWFHPRFHGLVIVVELSFSWYINLSCSHERRQIEGSKSTNCWPLEIEWLHANLAVNEDTVNDITNQTISILNSVYMYLYIYIISLYVNIYIYIYTCFWHPYVLDFANYIHPKKWRLLKSTAWLTVWTLEQTTILKGIPTPHKNVILLNQGFAIYCHHENHQQKTRGWLGWFYHFFSSWKKKTSRWYLKKTNPERDEIHLAVFIFLAWNEPRKQNPYYFPLKSWLVNDGILISWFMK